MAKPRANQDYGEKHAADCASGDRAEVRGECDCGAVDGRPWKLRVERTKGERPVVHVVLHRELTLRELTEMALSSLELTRIEGEQWGKEECTRLERDAKALRAKKGDAIEVTVVGPPRPELDEETPPWER